jgi:hypothetical protein
MRFSRPWRVLSFDTLDSHGRDEHLLSSDTWDSYSREEYCRLSSEFWDPHALYSGRYSRTFLWHVLFPTSRSKVKPRKQTMRHTAEGNALHFIAFHWLTLTILGEDYCIYTYSVGEGSWLCMCFIRLFILYPHEVEFFTYWSNPLQYFEVFTAAIQIMVPVFETVKPCRWIPTFRTIIISATSGPMSKSLK